MTNLSATTRMLVTRAKTAAAKARMAVDRHARAQRRAAIALTKMGISRRDAGDILGISHQRVHQLVSETDG